MGFNIAGLAGALNDVDQLSLHKTNPGLSASPAAGTELTDAPYARKACVFNAATDSAGSANSALDADVEFNLHLSVDQNVQFIGLWKGSVYKGYLVPDNSHNFTGTATTRTFTVKAGDTVLTAANPA